MWHSTKKNYYYIIYCYIITGSQENEPEAALITPNNEVSKSPNKCNKSSSSASESGSVKQGLGRRDTKKFNRHNFRDKPKQRGGGSSSSSDQNNMERKVSLTEKRPSITAEELTPIVLSQLQTTSKLKEENKI